MVLVTLCFIAIFALIASAGMLLFYRQTLLQRVSSVVAQQPRRAPLLDTVQHTGTSIGGLLGSLGRVVPKSDAEKTAVKSRLAQAGYRSESAARIFYGVKVVTPLALLLVAAATGLLAISPFAISVSALGLGLVLPDALLKRQVKLRQQKIRRGLPDTLDFMVICIEAGLGIDQATSRTADELKLAHPAISDELSLLVLEQRAGRPRQDAWRLFAERTDVDAVRVLSSALVQAEQLGTGIAKTLRIHSEAMRTERRQSIEEQAAKTSVKLVFPLVIFIFPSLFLVTMGPEAIMMAETFQTFFPH